ncbi:MAG: TolC family protein [Nitrospirota bacterium]
MNFFRFVSAIIFLADIGLLAAANPITNGPDVLIDILLAKNPQLRALEAEWKSARHQAVIDGALPDPMFTFGYYASSVETRVGPMQDKIGIAQKFPWFGKLPTARKAAAKEAAARELIWHAAGEDLALQVAMSYIEVAYSRDAIALLDKQIILTDEIKKAAERIYGSTSRKTAGQEDVLRFSVLADQFRDRRIMLHENEKLAVDRIERWLDGPLPKDASFSMETAARSRRPALPSAEDSFAYAYGVRPELLASELQLDAAQLRERIARLDYYPDFTFGLDYTVIGEANEMPTGGLPPDSGKNAAMVYFSINLPLWWDKQAAQVEQAKEKSRAQKNRILDLRAAIKREILDAYRNAQAAEESMRLHREKLIPQATRARELALAEYSSGRQNFLNVLDAENAVLNLQLGLLDVEAKAARAKWKLYRSLGVASLTGSPILHSQ